VVGLRNILLGQLFNGFSPLKAFHQFLTQPISPPFLIFLVLITLMRQEKLSNLNTRRNQEFLSMILVKKAHFPVAHRSELRGFHRLRTRRAGAVRHVDMHVLVDPYLTITDVHPVSDSIEREIESRLPGTICVIHVEPDDGLHTEEFDALVRERTSKDTGTDSTLPV